MPAIGPDVAQTEPPVKPGNRLSADTSVVPPIRIASAANPETGTDKMAGATRLGPGMPLMTPVCGSPSSPRPNPAFVDRQATGVTVAVSLIGHRTIATLTEHLMERARRSLPPEPPQGVA